MNKQDTLKVQTCVLRVHIHCHGCKDKVKKTLQKIPGVYKVIIDVEQGKVTVSGNVDPSIMIQKLEKSGKHAELWRAQNGQIPVNNMFASYPVGKMNNGGKESNGSQKGGKIQQKGGFQAPVQHKNVNFLGKNKKSAKLDMSEDESDDESDEDESDEEFVADQPSKKALKFGGGPQKAKANASSNGSHVKGGSNGENGKKRGGFDAFLKGMLRKAAGRSGGGGEKGSAGKEESVNQKQGMGKKAAKNVGFDLGGAKNGMAAHKSGKNNDSWGKKGGDEFDGGAKLEKKQQGLKELKANHVGSHGSNMGMVDNYPMGHLPNFPPSNGLQAPHFPPAQGLPAASMHGDRLAGQGNPYAHQQYMAQMMMNQRGNGQDMFHPMMFNRPHHPPPMNYGAAPVNDQFTHIFSDENTNACSIM